MEFLLNLIQHIHLLLQTPLLRIVRCNYRSQSTGGERKSEDSQNHQENAKDPLSLSVCGDISIADCHNGGHCEIQSSHIQIFVFHLGVTFLTYPTGGAIIVVTADENPIFILR